MRIVRALLVACLLILAGCQTSQPVREQSAQSAASQPAAVQPAQSHPSAGSPSQATTERTTTVKASGTTIDLLRTVWGADVAGFEKLLDAGVDPDAPWKSSTDTSPRYVVFDILWSQDLSLPQKQTLLEDLEKHGASFEVTTHGGMTPLYAMAVDAYAVADHAALAESLLRFGADPNHAATGYRYRMVDGTKTWIPETPLVGLLQCAKYTTAEKARMIGLFASFKAGLSRSPEVGMTLLQWVLNGSSGIQNREIVIRALFDAGIDVKAVTPQGSTVLHTMLWQPELDGYLDLITRALRAGADPRVLDGQGTTVFQKAFSARERLERRGISLDQVFDVLLKAGTDVNMPDKEGATVLLSAASEGEAQLVEWLLGKGASIAARDTSGNTALHAVLSRRPDSVADVVRLLVDRGIDVNVRGENGSTALGMAATDDRNLALLKYLVSKGADITIGDDDGVAPLGAAFNTDSKKNTAYLKSIGGVMYSSQFPAGNSAEACRAVLSGDPAAVASIPVEALTAMVARTSFGVPATPLHLAAEQGTMPVVEALCSRKVDWNVADRYGRSPLQCAVEAGRADVIARLLKAGADPNAQDSFGNTPFSRASGAHPELAALMLARGFSPRGDAPAGQALWMGNLPLITTYFKSTQWGEDALDFSATIGQEEITHYLGGLVPHATKSVEKLAQEAKENRQAFSAADAEAAKPLEVPRVNTGISAKRGTFTYIVESWSPWMEMKADKKLKDYPVGVYVPKGYDGSKPYGLLVSMIHAKSANQFPRPDFAKILDERRLIWVGFDPYNGIYEPFADTHECFSLAIVYNMLKHFSVDQSRIYMAGFSWGGRLTGEIVPRQPRVFKGGIAIGGCFTTRTRLVPALYYGREHVTMVMAAGDYDFNRKETYAGYDTLLGMGYRCSFIQEPLKGHSVFSAASFEKAIRILDEGAAPVAAQEISR
jgi:ankyrin repeat protein